MSTAKYANLPDIDLEGHDVYETPDVAPTPPEVESDEEDDGARSRGGNAANGASHEELDDGRLPPTEASGRFFRHAERRARRQRALYSYPDSSPSSSWSPSPSKTNLPLKERIEAMKKEIAVLVAEASNPDDEPTELIRELSDMRGRLSGIDSRTRLIKAMVNGKSKAKVEGTEVDSQSQSQNAGQHDAEPRVQAEIATANATSGASAGAHGLVDLDKRIAQLEKLVGSSGTSLDESSPLPQPLLPHLTRLSTLLTLLTQPRHIDSISRRLKLLLTDLERYNASATPYAQGTHLPPALAEVAPLLQRLAPHITTIPAVLARLRTLSTLHASAAGFGDAISGLEEDQRRLRAGLGDLEEAVKGLESSISENSGTITRNVEGLETRIASLEERLARLAM